MIIYNKEQFEEFYFYSKDQIKESDYPKEYPCVCKQKYWDGGLVGSHVDHVIIYAPKNVNKIDYFDGVLKGWET